MMLTGILAIDKPQGWTSHDVVARLRRMSGQRQVGHAGTLDPLATGLLLVVMGGATRFSSYLMASPKWYCAEIVLGATTVTDDAEGRLIARQNVDGIAPEQIEAALQSFRGEILQIPPDYAAVRHHGQKLYALARKGIDVAVEPRRVIIEGITVLAWSPPRLRLRIHCGPGTYIRALARDLGTALGCGGYLHALRRVASGGFTLADAHCLPDLDRDRLSRVLLPPDRAVLDLPAAVLSDEMAAHVAHGRPVALGGSPDGPVRLYGRAGGFLALAQCHGGEARPFLVMAG